jgi:hypothetical protein
MDKYIGEIQIKPISFLGHEYTKYIFSDIILVPLKYYDKIYSNNNELNVLKIKINEIETYGTVYNIVEDNCIYVSVTIFQYFKNNKINVYESLFNIYLCNNRLIKKDLVILKPLNIEFFDITDQLELLKNYIGNKYRVLYNNLILNIYSKEINKDLVFVVELDKDILIPALNIDLQIDFKPDNDLVHMYENKQQEEKIRLNRYLDILESCNCIISTKTEIIKKELTKEEIRQKRLEFIKK